MISPELKTLLERQQYGIAGSHSVVKICTWTKKSLRDEGVCYKQSFYGIRCHRCCQMSPTLACNNSCVFCWRDHLAKLRAAAWKGETDEPKDIIKKCVEQQIKLISGFGGNKKVNLKKFVEAKEPVHFAISLTGEPTLYPKLKELIEELHKQGKTTFLVTNGVFPEELEKQKPTQLYVSLDAPNKKLFEKIDKPMLKDSWERLMKTLDMLKKLKTRTVLRITAIKGLNMCNEEEYADIIKNAKPMFVEVKSYMFVGESRKRLKIENMPRHHEIMEFAKKIADLADYEIIDEREESRVALLMKKDRKDRIMKF